VRDPSLSFRSPNSFCSLSSQGVSIAQLADSEFVPSPSQLSSPPATPVSDMSHDTPSALPYGSPMSDALSPPSPLPVDEEMDTVAPADDYSPDPKDSRPPSPDASMEVTEDVSFEVPDEEPLPPPVVDSDPPVDAPTPLQSSSSEVGLAETRAETPQVEILSDTLDDAETMASVAPSEAAPVQPAVQSDEDSKSEELASPVMSEIIALEEDMDVDVVGEPDAEADEPPVLSPERSQSALPLTPQASQPEVQLSPSPSPSPSPPSSPPPPPPTLVPAPILALPPSAFILPPKPSTEVFIPATLAPVGESPQYALELATVEPRSLTTSEWLNPEFSLNRNYTLPPAKSLPPDQQRRLKLGKSQRRKDKGFESRKDGTDDWMPLGINKWGVTIKANPLWKRVSRATKTMTTRDWNVSIPSILVTEVPKVAQVAFTELRLLRVLERIEQLKEAGKWSYRQPKKQRGVGNVSKTHWDYLLDEMVRCSFSHTKNHVPKAFFLKVWMRTDFREERRWKISVAYKLAGAVVEWHNAGDRQTRKDRGIVVDWRRPVHDESRDIDDVEMIIEPGQGADEEMQDDTDERPFSTALISGDYGSDDSDDEQELEKQEVADALEPRAVLEEALGHAERSESTQPENEIRPKEEDLDDSSMLRDMQHPAITMDVHPKQDETSGNLADNVTPSGEPTQLDSHPGLKQTSDDPVLGADTSLDTTTERPISTPKQHLKSSVYSPLRGHIAHLDYDTLVLDFDDLYIYRTRDATSDDAVHDTHPLPSDVLQVFPDLPFVFTDPPPLSEQSTSQSAGKKKSERRDRDDPHRRSDPTTHNKMTAVGSFMRSRPTLLAALNPAVRWENDHWANFDDAPIIPDFDAPCKFLDEPTSSAFHFMCYDDYF